MEKVYDLIILGAGPAGLSAGIYAGRARLSTLIIEKGQSGGQVTQTSEIENYPGSLEEESGLTLTERMSAQVKKFGVERVMDTVSSVDLDGAVKKITGMNNSYSSRTVIIATGASPMPIDCPGEKEFVGKGVSYCATCDGAFFEDLEVYVVGGGDSAVEEAIYLTKFARKVTIIHRRDKLRAAKSIQEKAFSNPKIEFIWDSVVKELKGNGLLQSIIIENLKTKKQMEVLADADDGILGVFVFIGLKPQTQLFSDKINTEKGYIITDENMQTNIPGVFAAGDLRVKNLRQVVTAAADGAIAAVQAEKYVEQ